MNAIVQPARLLAKARLFPRWVDAVEKGVAKRDVRQQITVGVDVEPVNGVGMERLSIWICVEDDHGSRRVGGRLERVEIAQVESLVAERRTEAESSKMIRHFFLPFVRGGAIVGHGAAA